MGRAPGGKPEPKKKKAAKKRSIVVKFGDQILPAVKPERKSPPPNQLNELKSNHLWFANRLAFHGNASKAAREARFNDWYGSNVLAHDPLIIAEVARLHKKQARKFEITEERVLVEIARIAFGSIERFLHILEDGTPLVNLADADAADMATISQIEQDVYYEKALSTDEDGGMVSNPVKKTKVKFHNKLNALEMLARKLGLFGDDGATKEGTPEERAARIMAALHNMKRVDGA